MARGTKTENKSTPEKVKPTKELSPKRQTEANHLAGKHKTEDFFDCGYCDRRTMRAIKKHGATKRYLATKK